MSIPEWTRFTSPSGNLDVARMGGEVLIQIIDPRSGSLSLLTFPAAAATDIATRILELAGCRVRRVAFGHMLPDQVSVGVPPKIVDGEIEELPPQRT